MQRLSQIRKLSVPQTAPSYWLALQVPVLPWAQTPLGPVELHWVWTAIDLPTDFSENLAAAGPASPYRRLSSLYISAVETYFPGLRSKAWDWITPQTKSYLCLYLIFLYGGLLRVSGLHLLTGDTALAEQWSCWTSVCFGTPKSCSLWPPNSSGSSTHSTPWWIQFIVSTPLPGRCPLYTVLIPE